MIQSKFLEAMKETLTRKLDRKRASPTESAVMRESVKGTLWSWCVEGSENDDASDDYYDGLYEGYQQGYKDGYFDGYYGYTPDEDFFGYTPDDGFYGYLPNDDSYNFHEKNGIYY